MSKWNWAFGNLPAIPKFRWSVRAGDQEPESGDDKKCGEHYIAEDKDCQDGDAHRPDPGNNPYWQGGRKGPEDKSTDTSKRDRKEVTKKAKKKESERETPSTPESMGKWADERLSEYMEETETAHRDAGDDIDWDSEYGNTKLHELAEKTIRDTHREHPGQFDTRKSKQEDPDPEDTRHDPDVKHRTMYRPDETDKPITFEEKKHGDPVMVPRSPGQSVYKDLINRARSGGGGQKEEEVPTEKPRRKEAIEHTKKKLEPKQGESADPVGKRASQLAPEKQQQLTDWLGEKAKEGTLSEDAIMEFIDQLDSPEEADPVGDKYGTLSPQKKKQFDNWLKKKAKEGTLAEDTIMEYLRRYHPSGAESAMASALNWAVSKIMMDRADPKPGDQGYLDEDDLLALNSALPPLPGDSAEGRPCGEGEDPEQGHCKGPGGPMQTGPAGPMSDDPKTLRKMGGPPGGGGGGKPPTPPKGVGLDMPEDPKRASRTATHIQVMKNSDPQDPGRTSWAVNKMFGGAAIKPTPKGPAGASRPMAENLARQQYDDARHTMEQSGWQETSNMGDRTTWNKGGANITMQTGPSGTQGQYTNQFLVHTPKAAPKKRGLFGR